MARLEITRISLDKKTKNLIDDYANSHRISISALISLAVNKFFI